MEKEMKVLIAANSSENFDAAIEFIKGNSWAPQAVFNILHVIEPSEVTDLWLSLSGATRHREIMQERQTHALERLAELKSACLESIGEKATIETSVVIGQLDEAVNRHARDWEADLVVLGLPKATFIGRYSQGISFAHMMQEAPCPITFARPRPAVQPKRAS
jgi:nucleotide-binding universal stress UspA family protein